jgi:hypothetical protein
MTPLTIEVVGCCTSAVLAHTERDIQYGAGESVETEPAGLRSTTHSVVAEDTDAVLADD